MSNNQKVAICAILKMENNYLEEWLNYHFEKLKVDHIFLNDNNDPDGEEIHEIVNNNPHKDNITVIDCRGRKYYQTWAYTNCFRKYKKDFDWMIFIDLDEFIVIEDKFEGDIHNFLKMDIFDNINVIRLFWKHYGDNGLIENPEHKILDVFTECLPNHPKNHAGKSIIRTRLELTESYKITAHGYDNKLNEPAVDATGKRVRNTNYMIDKSYVCWENAWLNHYPTKSLKEYIEQKTFRGDPTTTKFDNKYNLEHYFEYNERTAEKMEFAQKYINETMKDRFLLVCIASREELYLRDWIEYHHNIGFTTIAVCDNSNTPSMIAQKICSEYDYVEYHNYREKTACQMQCYEEMYKHYHQRYRWIAFIDVDEYIHLFNHKTIQEFVHQDKFNDANMIYLHWRCFGDNDQVRFEKKPVYERFTKPVNMYWLVNEFPINSHIKAIVKTEGEYITFPTPHNPRFIGNHPTRIYNSAGKHIEKPQARLDDICWDDACINHYCTLTIDEYLQRRLNRKRATTGTMIEPQKLLNSFFAMNKNTREKVEIIKKYIKDVKEK